MEEEKAVGGGRKLKWFLMFCPPLPASVDWEAPRALLWLSVYYAPLPYSDPGFCPWSQADRPVNVPSQNMPLTLVGT